MNSDNRFEQLKALYNDGDPDIRELAGNEIITLEKPLEETVAYLLDLPVKVHPVRVQSAKSLNALRSLEQFIREKMRAT